ncbi:hypothetical protein D7S99_06390 [Burkholderia cepacia]|nr:hypothetical protein [Burkholderia cepacia]MBB0075945.1 hypothetical protein [Burkholderia cepacia]
MEGASAMPTSNRIDREALYEQAWSIPMIELGKEFGVFRPTIKWACKQLQIPLPLRYIQDGQ